MRRPFITSALLILVLVPSASACVAGCGIQAEASCSDTARRHACRRKEPGIAITKHSRCSPVVKSLPSTCGMRSFVPFQFVSLHAADTSVPLQYAAGHISLPMDSVIIISSIGSPETDRGPPRS